MSSLCDRPSPVSETQPAGGELAQRDWLSVAWSAARTAWGFLRSRRGQVTLAWVLALVLVAVQAEQVGLHMLRRYDTFHADAFDLGNMDQAVWNTLHGHPFRFTNRAEDWYGPPTRLGIHVEPIILLLAPLYLIHSGPQTLILLQSIALALGAIPLFLLARHRLPELPFVAVAFVASYLIAPALLGSAMWDFHPVALATPLLLTAIWALDARRYRWFVVAAILAAFTKEDVALALIPLGLYIAYGQRKRLLGLSTVALSIAWVYLCFGVILPHFNGGSAGGNTYWYRYAWLGRSAKAAAANALVHPWIPITYVLGDAAHRSYLLLLGASGGGFGLFAPALWICALPEIAVNVLSSHAEQYSGFFQYNAVSLPFLMAASVYGVGAWYRRRLRSEQGIAPAPRPDAPPAMTSRWRAFGARVRWLCRYVYHLWDKALSRIPIPTRFIGSAVIIWLLFTANVSLISADPRFSAFWHSGDAPAASQAQMNALLAQVPPDATVAASDSVDPHLSDRYTIYLMPDPQSYQAEYVAVDVQSATEYHQQADDYMFNVMLGSGHYELIGTAGGIVLLHRTGPPLDASQL